MEKDKKYNIVLGIMIFLFILVVGAAIAWGLGIIGLKNDDIKENNNNPIENNVDVKVEEESKEEFPKEVDVNSKEVKDIVNLVNTKIKFMTPSENYKDELSNSQIIEAAMFFYLNDYPERGGDEYIYTENLTPIINKYFGMANIEYGELEGYNYSYIQDKDAYITPIWGTMYMKIITSIEHIDKDTIYIYIDNINTALYDVTENTYTQNMVENKLIVTIKIEENNSFTITNYGYDK